MSYENLISLLEARLGAYNVEETLERLHSYECDGPPAEYYLNDTIELYSGETAIHEEPVEYSSINGAANDENYNDDSISPSYGYSA